MKVTVEGEPIGQALERTLGQAARDIRVAIRQAADAASTAILDRGRADIRAAGRFGTRWTEGLTADVTEDPSTVTITVREAVPYWTVFQFGKVIRGRPLLWIPSGPDTPRYLFRRGVPPAVISVRQVRIPKKFHLIEIARQVGGTLGQLYKVHSAGI